MSKISRPPIPKGKRGKSKIKQPAALNKVAQMPGIWPPRVDVIGELQERRGNYTVEDGDSPSWLGVRSFPAFLRQNLDKLRSRVVATTKPGRSIAATCCIQHGLRAIEGHRYVQALRNMNEEIQDTDFEYAVVEELINDWCDDFDIGVVIPGRGRRLNICMPSDLKSELHRAADALGLSDGALAVMACMATLSTQKAIHERLLVRIFLPLGKCRSTPQQSSRQGGAWTRQSSGYFAWHRDHSFRPNRSDIALRS